LSLQHAPKELSLILDFSDKRPSCEVALTNLPVGRVAKASCGLVKQGFRRVWQRLNKIKGFLLNLEVLRFTIPPLFNNNWYINLLIIINPRGAQRPTRIGTIPFVTYVTMVQPPLKNTPKGCF
jgi:hypothetical protein